ncbi:MAG: hypothetical protein LBI06_00340 [Treponema sp.]|nr:hypothetical protein [Treponema sp.]
MEAGSPSFFAASLPAQQGYMRELWIKFSVERLLEMNHNYQSETEIE